MNIHMAADELLDASDLFGIPWERLNVRGKDPACDGIAVKWRSDYRQRRLARLFA